VSAVVEFEGDRVFGDVDGELMVGVGASGSDFLSNDHDDTTVGRAALHGGWFGRGAGWGFGRASAAQLAGLVPAQRVGSGAEQFPGVGVEEHQGGGLDADADPGAGEDFRGEPAALASTQRHCHGVHRKKQRRSRCSGASDVLAEITDEIRGHCVRAPPPLVVH